MSKIKQPLNAEIANEIRKAIISRQYTPGDNLPTENELAAQYNTSRVTVRKALNVLCNEDLIFSHQGKGYFVSKPDYNRYSMQFELIKPYHKVKFKKLTIIEPSDEIKAILSLKDDNVVILIQIVLYENQIPVACEDKYLPYTKGFPTIESVMRYADFPELVDKKLTHFEQYCELRISPGKLPAEHAGLMHCESGEPVLLVKRMIKNETGNNIGYGLTFLREEYGNLSARSGYIKNYNKTEDKRS